MKLLSLISIILACTLSLTIQAATTSATNHKLDKHLALIAAAVQENREQPLMAAALTRELFRQQSPLEARWNAAGQVQIYLHYDRNGSPPGNAELKALGASGILNSLALGVIQAWIPANKLQESAALPGVIKVSLPHYALARRTPPIYAQPRTGSVDTQGDQILGAAQFRSATNYTGQGMVVGVISDGDSGNSTSQGTGDLPLNIWDDPNNSSWGSSGAEGTAMMEIVYDIAPGVKQLGFAGPGTSAEFLTALDDFAGNINPNVIVDDLGFPGLPMFTNGDFANGVQQFATTHPDIHLVSAAGNDATAFWAGAWNPYTLPGAGVTINGVTYTQAMNFGTTLSTNIKLQIQDAKQGDSISYILEWDDPWVDSSTTNLMNDYDVVMFDSSGNPIACNQGINVGPVSPATSGCTQTNNTGELNTPGPLPVQGSQATLAAKADTAYLEIFHVADTSSSRNFKILVSSTNSNQIGVTPPYPDASIPGSIYGHSAVGVPVGSAVTPVEITVGAVCATQNQSCNGANLIESYSSLGPVQFGILGTGAGTQPTESIQKPDFVAPDCVDVTGAGDFSTPFCGTSAAAPHIAGLLALLIPAYPSKDPYTLLQDSASQPEGGANPNGTYGFGLPNVDSLLTSGTYPATGAEITNPTSGATIQGGQSTKFEGQCLGYDGTSNFTYNWDFGTSSIPDSTSQSPSITYNNSGTYNVTLTCTNKMGSGSNTETYTVAASRFSGSGGSMDLLVLAVLGLLAFMRVVSTHRHT